MCCRLLCCRAVQQRLLRGLTGVAAKRVVLSAVVAQDSAGLGTQTFRDQFSLSNEVRELHDQIQALRDAQPDNNLQVRRPLALGAFVCPSSCSC